VRRALVGIVVSLVAAGCGELTSDGPVAPIGPDEVLVAAAPSPFSQVTAGPVRALIPDGWRAVPADLSGSAREGFVASPRPAAWGRPSVGVAGLSATWVDATAVGVPSDFYYLAATGPVLSELLASDACKPVHTRIYVNNRPAMALGPKGSPGDYLASGEGVCHGGLRWAYFVAAPGFGPARHVGIPSSGLYLVVAMMPDAVGVRIALQRLLRHTSFNGAGMADFVAATKASIG
jgi:hypothetical protein